MHTLSPTTSYVVIGAGVVVTLIAWTMVPNPIAYGAVGFGLAHIVLGLLDLLRTGSR